MGALTSKPYAFNARSWELKSVFSIDFFDGMGSSIRIDLRGTEVLRVVPSIDRLVNDEWISDKTRFFYDSLKRQRVGFPLFKSDIKRQRLSRITWSEAIAIAKSRLIVGLNRIDAIFGKGLDLLSLIAAKNLLADIGSYTLFFNSRNFFNIDNPINYRFNSSFSRLDQINNLVLVCCNPRLEAPVLNLKLRRRAVNNGTFFSVTMLGASGSGFINYPCFNLGSVQTLFKLIAGRLSFIQRWFNTRVAFIIGENTARRSDFSIIYTIVKLFLSKIYRNNFSLAAKSFNYLHNNISTPVAFDIGLLPTIANSYFLPSYKPILYNFANDDYTYRTDDYSFVIYQGHHGDINASKANLVFPVQTTYERELSYYSNSEGLYQKVSTVLEPMFESKPETELLDTLRKGVKSFQSMPVKRSSFLRSLLSFASSNGFNLIYLILVVYYRNFVVCLDSIVVPSFSSLLLMNLPAPIPVRTFRTALELTYSFIYFRLYARHNPSFNFLLGYNIALQYPFVAFLQNIVDMPYFLNYYTTDSLARSSQILALTSKRFKEKNLFS